MAWDLPNVLSSMCSPQKHGNEVETGRVLEKHCRLKIAGLFISKSDASQANIYPWKVMLHLREIIEEMKKKMKKKHVAKNG